MKISKLYLKMQKITKMAKNMPFDIGWCESMDSTKAGPYVGF